MNYFKKTSISPGYWCSWATQCFSIPDQSSRQVPRFPGDQGCMKGRDNLCEERLFAEDGMCSVFPEIRNSLFFLIDDGWDVPFLCNPAQSAHMFGGMRINTERFPSCAGSPSEGLSKLNLLIRAYGWRGTGLWVAAQAARASEQERLSELEMERYWRDRLRWSREAGIALWKVDWGQFAHDLKFRDRLTQWAQEEYPELLVEQCYPMSPLNDLRFEDGKILGTGQFENSPEYLFYTQTLKHSRMVRTYDTITPMFIASTLDRTAALLKYGASHRCGEYLCTEDPVYLGVTLGTSLGIMRSNLWTNRKTDAVARRADRVREVIRAVRGQSVVPAAPISAGEVNVSTERLTDRWFFESESTWFKPVFGREIIQSAPAVIARNCPLPEVTPDEREQPFVTAFLHPNGAFAGGFLPRLLTGKGCFTPGASVRFGVDCLNRKSLLCGRFSRVTFPCSARKTPAVWLQDPAADHAQLLTDGVTFDSGELSLDGRILDQYCANPDGDVSDPAILIEVMESL